MNTFNKDNFLRSARKICNFCAEYDKTKNAISSHEPLAVELKKNQIKLANIFKSIISEKEYDEIYDVKISKGMPSVPRVPWISLVRKGEKVYRSLSITACFGRTGNGFVFGLMKPVEYNKKLTINTIERNNADGFIDVNSNRSSTSYNNKFINPVDFFITEFNYELLVSTLMDSILLEEKYHSMTNDVEFDQI